MTATPPTRQCLSCTHFRNDARTIEMSFKGLASLGSGFAAVRADDGLCLRHDRYLGARGFCADYVSAYAGEAPERGVRARR